MTKPRKSRFQLDQDLNISFDTPYVVLVEGVDDQAVVSMLIELMNLSDFHVVDVNGKSKWSKKIGLIAKDASFITNAVAIGAVRDADSNPLAALNSCKTAFRTAGLPVPNRALEVAAGQPSTAIFITPSENGWGAIEELCLNCFDPMRMECVDAYFECLSKKNFTAPRTGKGLVQVYLGGLQSPPRDIVVATAKRKIDLNDPCFNEMRKFLTDLSAVPVP
jgi:hypothetical protein